MKKAQNLVDYILILTMVAIIAFGIATRFDLGAIRNHVFVRPTDSANPSHIKIEAMTDIIP